MPELKDLLAQPQYIDFTFDALSQMADEPVNKPRLMAWLADGVEKHDGRYELRTALTSIAAWSKPKSYLEIGVFRGWSLAQVVRQAPNVNVVACDMWIGGYASAANPGPDFVRSEIERVAPKWSGSIEFRSIDSKDLTLDSDFDLITVDGDHSVPGTFADLRLTMQHLAPGGYLLLDDLVDSAEGGGSIRDVWAQIKLEFPDYEYIDNLDSIVPLGIAHRKAIEPIQKETPQYLSWQKGM